MSSETTATRRRPDPVLFGTVAFLASELMFFGSLFAAYFTLRGQSTVWPPGGIHLDALEPAVATALLLLSSGTMQLATARARAADPAGMRRLIVLSLVLGAVFLGSQVRTWVVEDLSISTNAYGTMFYGMTGFHALHVLAGVVLMLVVLGRASQGAYRDGNLGSLEASAYYWHFVDAVWIALFATIYLVR
jgi:cytochrome c oxidase subunit 3